MLLARVLKVSKKSITVIFYEHSIYIGHTLYKKVIFLGIYDTQITALFSFNIFAKMLNNVPISIYEFNLATNYLMISGIPYDVSFVPGTRKEAAALQLTIHINPTRTEVIVVSLQQGSTTFTPSP